MPEELPHSPAPTPHSGTVTEPLEAPRTNFGCVLLVLIAIAAGSYAAWHYYKNSPQMSASQKQKVHATNVRVDKVKRMTIPVEIHGVGNVLAYSTVGVTSEITGQLQKVFFKEGDYVTKGQPLFAIDSRPQQASVDQLRAQVAKDQAQVGQLKATVDRDLANVHQAEANLTKDQAQEKFSKVEEVRYHTLVKQGYVTIEQYQQELATEQSAVATVGVDKANIASAVQTMHADEASIESQVKTKEADEASLRNAQVQLSYTYITSPLSGRTGGLSVYAGNLVQASGSTALVTIAQITPIYITFSVPEQYLSLIQTLQARQQLSVQAIFSDSTTPPEKGRITFIDNNVDTTTGTIALRGTFTNTSRHLWPGRFVTVTLLLENETNAIVVPSQAVQPSQNGNFIFVVQNDDTVKMLPIKVERIVGNNTIVTSGVQPGQTIVTDGQLQLTDGAPVKVITGKSKASIASPTPGGGTDSGTGAPSDTGSPASPSEEGSGSPSDDSSPAHHGHHHHPASGGSSLPSDSSTSASPSGQGFLAVPTDPLTAGPVIPTGNPNPLAIGTPTPAATPVASFPAGSGSNLAALSVGTTKASSSASTSTSTANFMGGLTVPTLTAGGGQAAATPTPSSASTGLPGTVQLPGAISTPGVLQTLQPVTIPTSGLGQVLPSVPSQPPSFAAGPPTAGSTASPAVGPVQVTTAGSTASPAVTIIVQPTAAATSGASSSSVAAPAAAATTAIQSTTSSADTAAASKK